jgi:site-specific DNA-methyltransferase (adenine-specific)
VEGARPRAEAPGAFHYPSQPFTSILVASNLAWFRYCWIYQKDSPTGFLDAQRRPMNDYEDICVFSRVGQIIYNPQGVDREVAGVTNRRSGRMTEVYQPFKDEYTMTGTGYPRRVLKFKRPKNTVHPTQKPMELYEYLIRTYTNPGDVVLDATTGSGTTGVACVNIGDRHFIGVELDIKYYRIAQRRIAAAQKKTGGVIPPMVKDTRGPNRAGARVL